MGFRMSTKQAMRGIPSYRRHKDSGQAVVTLNGVGFYLGPYGSPQSKAEYDRVTAEWLARGRRAPAKADESGDLLVKELILGYHGHLAATSPEIADKVKQALRIVREMYGATPAARFGPIAFKAIRLKMIEAGLAITTIRDRMGVIRRMVAWGVENEMLPADALQRIKAVSGLRVGRDNVKPSRKVKPAPQGDIEAILPHLGAVVRAMVELQALTGMRPQEVRLIRTGWIDRSGELWIYRPIRHKTADLGKVREIPLGPRAQEVLMPWLKADPDAPLFSPAESRAAVLKDQRARRKTKVQPSQRDRRKKNPKRRPGATYTRDSYKQAVERGCGKAGVPIFRPNQIRHAFATRIRREYGLEAAQILLGHSKADVTQIYAERNLALAAEIARKIG
jgi:integrase